MLMAFREKRVAQVRAWIPPSMRKQLELFVDAFLGGLRIGLGDLAGGQALRQPFACLPIDPVSSIARAY